MRYVLCGVAVFFFGQKKRKSKKEEEEEESKRPRLDLHPETKKSVWAILLFTFALIIFLSFWGQAGKVGIYISNILEALFGFGKYLVPFIVLVAAFIFLSSGKRNVYLSTFLGGFLFIFSILGVSEIIGGKDHWGGYLGRAAALPFLNFFGTVATVIILGAILIISLLIFFNVSLRKFKKESEEKEPVAPQNQVKEGEGVVSGIVPSITKFFKKPEFEVKEIEENLSNSRKNHEKSDEDEEKLIEKIPNARFASYKFPPFSLLASDTDRPTSGDIKANSNIIKRTLQNFGIDVEMGEINIGPTVTQYTLKPAEGIKLSRIVTLQNDLALVLAAHQLRMEAPIPGKSLVGIEIPNKSIATVRLRGVIENPFFANSPSNLTFPLGRDVSGNPMFADIKRMPHMLIAGSTGSGKTIALNCLILSLLFRNSPDILKLILIDPKRVEFPIYNGLPHLLAPVITESQKTVNALKWLIKEMERRFDVLAGGRARDILAYNSDRLRLKRGELMPYIVVIIDELADLMASRGKEVEGGIIRLAQMARAVGIHLVVATQRPSVEVITGLIKANITSRIAFQVASQVDSRTILDMAGAEKLLGSGDMLFLSAETSKPKRIQGSFVSDKEIKRVIDFIKEENIMKDEIIGEEIEFGNNINGELETSLAISSQDNMIDLDNVRDDDIDDDLYEEAKKVVIQSKKASASLLQRRLRVGYARAARLIDMLEEREVVGPGDGAKPREVYMEEDEENMRD